MRKVIVPIILVIAMSVMAVGFGKPDTAGMGPGFSVDRLKTEIENMPLRNISQDELKWLLRMREEEKLARDVYLTLYDMWKHLTFKNISKSEQAHMDMVKILLDKYGIEDPIKDDKIGVFTDEEIARLYKKLVQMGSKSLLDALIVGMIIEDMDIYDLEEALKKTDNEDIKMVYENLMKGSRNHMRSFYKQLKMLGGDYKPQYITKEEFEKIISTPIERG